MAHIPGSYICTLQTCDIDVVKPIKIRTKCLHIDWSKEQLCNFSSIRTVCFPDKTDVIGWLCNAWNKMFIDLIQKLLEKIKIAPGNVSPPETPYPDATFRFSGKLYSDEDSNDDIL